MGAMYVDLICRTLTSLLSPILAGRCRALGRLLRSTPNILMEYE